MTLIIGARHLGLHAGPSPWLTTKVQNPISHNPTSLTPPTCARIAKTIAMSVGQHVTLAPRTAALGMIADRSRASTYLPEKDAKARTVTCAVLPEGAHYSSETRKRRFVSECVVGPGVVPRQSDFNNLDCQTALSAKHER
jgi:hypothetical protein